MDLHFHWTAAHAPIVAAWQQHLTLLKRTPWLLRTLLAQGPEVGQRFATLSQQLRALPRRVRRALGKEWATALASLALLLALGQGPALAAPIMVDLTPR